MFGTAHEGARCVGRDDPSGNKNLNKHGSITITLDVIGVDEELRWREWRYINVTAI